VKYKFKKIARGDLIKLHCALKKNKKKNAEAKLKRLLKHC